MPREEFARRYDERAHDHVRAFLGARELEYNPHPEVVSNSRSALRLGELARERGLHDSYHERVMEAYWAQALDIGDTSVLRALAGEIGLPVEEVDDVLDGERYLDVVLGSTRQAVSVGVTGVPAFLLAHRLLVLGAQPDDVFEQAFARLASE